MHHTFVLAVLILMSSLTSASAQSNLNIPSDKQRITIAQQKFAGTTADDRAFWDSVKDSKNPEEFKAYLEQFPNGIFAALAHMRLKALEKGGMQSQSDSAVVSAPTGPKEIGRDGDFIAYDNGTVVDTRRKLMWASEDNGGEIDFLDAKRYCENYRGGGYSDWRMPKSIELMTLPKPENSQQVVTKSFFRTKTNSVCLTKLIRLTGPNVWAAEVSRSQAISVWFGCENPNPGWHYMSGQSASVRALPVRFVE